MGLLARGGGEEDEERGEVSIAGMGEMGGGPPSETEYVLDEWSEQDRRILQERMETLGVPHRWEGATVVVASADDAWTERVMDQVEADLDDVEAEMAAGTVGYDLTEWDDDRCKQLMDFLEVEGIAYQLDENELFVDAMHEERTDELVTVVLDPLAVVLPADGGIDVMSEMFVSADRLARDPSDHAGRNALSGAVAQGGVQGAPYGMDAAWWKGVMSQAQAVVATMETVGGDDDDVSALARALRDHLRPFI
jgi:hypothetical protein